LLDFDIGHISEAEKWIKRAIAANRKNQMRLHLAKDYKVYSELLKRKGDKLQAREKLSKAIRIFQECGAVVRAERLKKNSYPFDFS
jgi:tetratricopeptide (TPR) repeat protein